MWVRVDALVEAESTRKELLRPVWGAGVCKSAKREDPPGQDFILMIRLLEVGESWGLETGTKISLALIHLWNPLKLFILSRLWGKIEIKY